MGSESYRVPLLIVLVLLGLVAISQPDLSPRRRRHGEARKLSVNTSTVTVHQLRSTKASDFVKTKTIPPTWEIKPVSWQEVKFMEYPHNPSASWALLDPLADEIPNGSAWLTKWLPSSTTSGYPGVPGWDSILQSAWDNGVWLGHNGRSQAPRIFSTAEARQCLAGRRVVLAGDSYMLMTFIGLANIVLGDPGKKGKKGEIRQAWQRKYEVVQLSKKLDALSLETGPMRGTAIEMQCSFKKPFLSSDPGTHCYDNLTTCGECLSELGNEPTPPDAIFLSTTIHPVERDRTGAPNQILEQIESIFGSAKRLTWLTGPKYEVPLIPAPFNPTMSCKKCMKLGLFDSVSKGATALCERLGIPYISFRSLTADCLGRRCTRDGGHRKRFVAHMKAQLILNRLCR